MVCFLFYCISKQEIIYLTFYSAVFNLNVTITILFKHIIRKLRYRDEHQIHTF
jgi:hypothetical protein